MTPKTPNDGQKPRKYNDPKDLDELCKGFLEANAADKGAAIEYCKNFLSVLTEKPPVTGAVLSPRAKSR